MAWTAAERAAYQRRRRATDPTLRAREKLWRRRYGDRHRKEIAAKRKGRYGRDPEFRRRHLVNKRRRYLENHDEIRGKANQWARVHPDLVRDWRLRSQRGVTLAQYNEMLVRQGRRCAICHRTREESGQVRPFSVDHDHKSGLVRGLLCARCNIMVGYLEHGLKDAALSYLSQTGST